MTLTTAIPAELRRAVIDLAELARDTPLHVLGQTMLGDSNRGTAYLGMAVLATITPEPITLDGFLDDVRAEVLEGEAGDVDKQIAWVLWLFERELGPGVVQVLGELSQADQR